MVKVEVLANIGHSKFDNYVIDSCNNNFFLLILLSICSCRYISISKFVIVV